MNVKEITDRIITACGAPDLPQTCDQLIEGSWQAEVRGIGVTFMATVEVIQQAIARGINLIITHEPTYFNGWDHTDALSGEAVFEAKRALIRANGINIWRFHDHAHFHQPDLIYMGLDKELGWQSYHLPEDRHCYRLPPTTLAELTAFLKERLQAPIARIIGDPALPVERVGVLVGGGSLGLGSEQMPMELMRAQQLDVMVCGEIVEWTLAAFVRDAVQLGMPKAMIVLGHNRTEEVGMQCLPAWLAEVLSGVPVTYLEAGEPFDLR